MLKHFDQGKREEFFELWSEHTPSDIIDNDPTLKSLEFLLYTHFAVYYLRPRQTPNEELARENMQVFKSYMEAIKGQSLSQATEILPLFALPYVTSPEQHASFQDLFSVCLRLEIREDLIKSILGTMVNCITVEIIKFFRLDFFQSTTAESGGIIAEWRTCITFSHTIE